MRSLLTAQAAAPCESAASSPSFVPAERLNSAATVAMLESFGCKRQRYSLAHVFLASSCDPDVHIPQTESSAVGRGPIFSSSALPAGRSCVVVAAAVVFFKDVGFGNGNDK